MFLLATSAQAQLTSAGPAVSPPPAAGTMPVRWPDVAFDPDAGVWLGVSGADNVQGQWFTAAGAVEGAAFTVDADAFFAQCPRVAFGGGAFFVTWHASISMSATRVRGRLLRHGPPALTQDFDVSPDGTNWEMGAAVAAGSGEFLVAWQSSATKIQAQRVGPTGAKLGAVIDVDSAAPYARDPAVAYDPVTDTFVVAYAGCVGNDDCFVRAQRVKGGTGARVGTSLTLDEGITAGYVPEVAYDAANRRWLAVWYRATPGARSLEARTIAPDGTLGTRRTASAMYASYDANSVAWSPVSGTFVVVTHATDQDVAVELDAEGAPLNAPGLLWGPTGSTGNFNPRIAANGRAPDFFGVTSTMFASLSGQRLTTGTRLLAMLPDAGPDAGTVSDAGVDAGATVDAGVRPQPDAGTMTVPTMPGASCGCSSGPGACLLLVLALLRRASGAGTRESSGTGGVCSRRA
ncbi:MAG: hypothetical protein JNK82_19520 [Myxococcaceae bacterium]|nr:hypothetical protein [Myxococcaceae bacterium]